VWGKVVVDEEDVGVGVVGNGKVWGCFSSAGYTYQERELGGLYLPRRVMGVEDRQLVAGLKNTQQQAWRFDLLAT
jgi:hypothetical protein